MELSEFLSNINGKVLIAGIGNPLRGDDYVGSYIIKNLKNKINAILIDCEDKPENFIEQIIHEKPDTIIFIDALQMNKLPGSVCFITDKELSNKGLSTHRLSLKISISYIKARINSRIMIIGIQPKTTGFGDPMSEEVAKTVQIIQELFIKFLR
ncbi:MAG: hydrogenase 3 maturation endopeptidase HyCI [Thermodesulfovibrio sp.]|uniref:hydrogenase 3 maturation endopeptidase HyCI n=1 Tax=Thermodesulfovibrio sp. 1176 TaxID=3043424 RepID=UPI0024824F6B|nr:hydrogenase 3 maturation endopeptidase HyCI [Thermodesulfovibrio sp. 1176]MDI6714404.1 hydrogenase 3 maturation endopeptidase HyCI [Thermodesulfovibrio sp.]